MNKEENYIDILNNDGYLEVDEENILQQGSETFSAEESIKVSETSNENLEENDVAKNSKKENIKIDNATSNIGPANSIFGIVGTVVGSVAIIGTAVGLIPSMSSFHVSNFLSRSNKLGFEIANDNNKTYVLNLYNDNYSKAFELVDISECVFSDLEPNTVYNLVVYDTTSGTNKEVYNANYMTKTVDNYNAEINNIVENNNHVQLYFDYEGKNIEFVTIEVFEKGKSIFLYEGNQKEELEFDIGDANSYFTCKVYINGELANFIKYNEPEPKPGGDHEHVFINWISDDDTHWHECIYSQCEGLKFDEAEHDYVKVDEYESTYYTLYRCSVCGHEKTVEKEVEYIYYELNSGEDGYILTGYNKDRYNEYTDGVNLVIPSEYNGLPVVEIGAYALQNNQYIESIVIPDTVTMIGQYAFEYIQNVTTIFVPDSVTFIGEGAFRDCLVLEELTIPFVGGEVRHIFDDTSFFGYIFGKYSQRDTFNSWGEFIRAESSDGSITTEYYIPNSLVKLNITGSYEMNESVLRGIMRLKEINITGEITEIPDYLFADILDSSRGFVTKLDTIYLPKSITSIGKYAFADLQELTEINFAGTMDEWEAITKDSDWNHNTDSYSGEYAIERVICSDGTISIS